MAKLVLSEMAMGNSKWNCGKCGGRVEGVSGVLFGTPTITECPTCKEKFTGYRLSPHGMKFSGISCCFGS